MLRPREREGIEIGRTTLRRKSGCPARACRWTVVTTGGLETMVLVVNALFCEQENTRDYFLLMRGLIQR